MNPYDPIEQLKRYKKKKRSWKNKSEMTLKEFNQCRKPYLKPIDTRNELAKLSSERKIIK